MSAQIPVFRGRNFEFWKFKLANFFEGKGLERTLRQPDQMDKSWSQADAKARMYILESVDDEHVELIMEETSAAGMVRQLEAMYSAVSAADAGCANGSKKALRDDFLALQMAEDDDPSAFFLAFETYVNRLDDSGDRLSPKEILDCLLMSVGKSYRHLFEQVDRRLEPSEAVEVAKQKILAEYAARTNGAKAVDGAKDVGGAKDVDGAKAVDGTKDVGGAKAVDGSKVESPPPKGNSWNTFKADDGAKVESPPPKGNSWNAFKAVDGARAVNGARTVNGAKTVDGSKVESPPPKGNSWNTFKAVGGAKVESPPPNGNSWNAFKAVDGAEAVNGTKVESPPPKGNSWNAFKAVDGAKAVDGTEVESPPPPKSDSWNAFKETFKGETTECHRCGESGHWARECHQPRECYKCGQEGHMKFQCPLLESCYGCGQAGHLKFQCTQKQESCYGCGQEGHRKFECPDRSQPPQNHPAPPVQRPPASMAARRRSVPSAGPANGWKRGEPYVQQLPALMAIAVSPPAGAIDEEPTPKIEWILDACATEHTICDESLFSKCGPWERVIERINGRLVSAIKMGEVRVAFRVGNRFQARVLPKVYLIEGFEQNLLSIQRLVQFGGSVVLKASEVELRDPTNEVVARGKRVENLYVIESYSEMLATINDFDSHA